MSRALGVTAAVARRNLTAVFKTPALLLPPLVAPIVFFISFAGGLSSLGGAPGFSYAPGYTSFQLVFVITQGAGFAGVIAGMGIARDFESGFVHRLMLAAGSRRAVLAGYVVTALVRASLTMAVLAVAAVIAGARFLGGPLDLLGVLAVAYAMTLLGTLWAAGVALRLRTVQAAPLMQIPIFLMLFLAPVFVPLSLLTGWLHAAARVNPVARLLEAGRGFLAGHVDGLGLTMVIVGAALVVMTVWSLLGLRRAERAGL